MLAGQQWLESPRPVGWTGISHGYPTLFVRTVLCRELWPVTQDFQPNPSRVNSSRWICKTTICCYYTCSMYYLSTTVYILNPPVFLIRSRRRQARKTAEAISQSHGAGQQVPTSGLSR